MKGLALIVTIIAFLTGTGVQTQNGDLPQRSCPPDVANGELQIVSFQKEQFKELIETTLDAIGLNSPGAVELLLGTAAQESHFGTYLRQVGGPAKGVFQMEPITERDIWDNYLRHRPELMEKIKTHCRVDGPVDSSRDTQRKRRLNPLEHDLAYQIAMARIQYLRAKPALPQPGDVEAQADYWKTHYNTVAGRGRPSEFVHNFNRFVREG